MAMMSDWDADGEYEASCYECGPLGNHRTAGLANDAELDHMVARHKVKLNDDGTPSLDGRGTYAKRMKLTRDQKRNKFRRPGTR